jgi:hypothetical protein
MRGKVRRPLSVPLQKVLQAGEDVSVRVDKFDW